MKKSRLKQGVLVSLFVDGLVGLSLVLPWFEQVIDNIVDYYRHLLLKGKTLHCPVCLSVYVVKNGRKPRLFGSPVQNYLCGNCGKQFCENIFHRFYRYKYPVYCILLALDLRRRGHAVSWIVGLIFVPLLNCLLNPCYATITRWIKQFGRIAVARATKFNLKAGRRKHWEIDEEYDSRIVEIEKEGIQKKKKAGTFGIIDPYTKLISIETFTNNLDAKARSMILRTQFKWQTKPRSIWRDGWNAYDKILDELGIPSGTVIHSKEFVSKRGHHDNNMEREWGEKRTWNKPCRGFTTIEGRAFYDKLYELHRNFFTPREALNGLTPAQKAGVKENVTLLSLVL